MIETAQLRVFWNKVSPLASLFYGGLLIIASDRLAHAITVTAALVWVYCLTSLVVHTGTRIFPRQGRLILFTFLTVFITSVFLFLLWILSPLCFLQMFFVVSLVPVLYLGSGILHRQAALSLRETIISSAFEALVPGVLIIIFALIREPLGFLSLSLPGGAQGIILLFSFDAGYILPVNLVASSSGALFLLGYFWGLYRYFKARYVNREAQ
jgi:hypothetical protein